LKRQKERIAIKKREKEGKRGKKEENEREKKDEHTPHTLPEKKRGFLFVRSYLWFCTAHIHGVYQYLTRTGSASTALLWR